MTKPKCSLLAACCSLLLLVAILITILPTPHSQVIAAPLHATATPPVYTHLSDLEVQDWLAVAAQTAISVTHDAIITPTGSYQQLESAGTVGTSSIAAGSAGQILVLVNTTNTTITISDTGTLKLSSNAALGQYDSLTLISDGTNWIEIGEGGN
jgi:hypothetical protein